MIRNSASVGQVAKVGEIVTTVVLHPTRSHSGIDPIVCSTGSTTIGASDDCDCVLPLGGIEAKHCTLTVQPGRISLQAISPMTWINDGPVRDSALRDGDRVAIGPLEFRARVTQSPVAPAPHVAIPPASNPQVSGSELLDAIAAQISGRLQNIRQQSSADTLSPQSAMVPPPLPQNVVVPQAELPRTPGEAGPARRSVFEAAEAQRADAQRLRAEREAFEQKLADEQRRLAERERMLNEKLEVQRTLEQRLATQVALAEQTAAANLAARQSAELVRQEQLDQLERELHARCRQIEQQESHIAERERELQLARQKFEETSQKVRRESSELTEIRVRLETERREVTELTEQLKTSQQQWQEMQTSLIEETAAARSRFAERETQLVEQERGVALRTKELNEREATLAEQVRSTKHRHSSLMQQLQDLVSQERTLQEAVQRQQAEREEFQRLQQQLDAVRNEVAQTRQELEQQRTAIGTEQESLELQRQELATATEQLLTDRQALADAQAACEANQCEIQESLREIDARRVELEAKAETLEQTAAELERRAESIAAERIALAEQVSAAEQTNATALLERNSLMAATQGIPEIDATAIDRAESDRLADEQRLEAIQRVEMAQAELASQQADLMTQQADIRAAIEQLAQDRADLVAERERLAGEQELVASAQAQIAVEREQLNSEKKSLQARSEEFDQRTIELNQRLAQLERREVEFTDRVTASEQAAQQELTNAEATHEAQVAAQSTAQAEAVAAAVQAEAERYSKEIATREDEIQKLTAEHAAVVDERDRLHDELLSLFDLRTQQEELQSQLVTEQEELSKAKRRIAEQAAELESQVLALKAEAESLEQERDAYIVDRQALIAERQMAETDREQLSALMEELQQERQRCQAEREAFLAEQSQARARRETIGDFEANEDQFVASLKTELSIDEEMEPSIDWSEDDSRNDAMEGAETSVTDGVDSEETVTSSGHDVTPVVPKAPGADLMAMLHRISEPSKPDDANDTNEEVEAWDSQSVDREVVDSKIETTDRDEEAPARRSNDAHVVRTEQSQMISSSDHEGRSDDPEADELRNRLAELFGIPESSNASHGHRHSSTTMDDENTDSLDHAKQQSSQYEEERYPQDEQPEEVDEEVEAVEESPLSFGGDDSIASYMEQLLARTRRTGDGHHPQPVVKDKDQPAPAAMKTKVVEPAVENSPSSIKVEAEKEATKTKLTENRKELAKRHNDSIRVNLDSMREIANRSARSAVARHQTRQLSVSTQIQLALTSIGAVITLILLTAEFWGPSYRWQGLGTLLVTMTSAVVLFLNERKVRRLQRISETTVVDSLEEGVDKVPTVGESESQLETLRALAKKQASTPRDKESAAPLRGANTPMPKTFPDERIEESPAGETMQDEGQFTEPRIIHTALDSLTAPEKVLTDEDEARLKMLAGVADFSNVRDRKIES
ncbi:MAG: FHA domain-containing protein [Planctomycetaceae bacterium]